MNRKTTTIVLVIFLILVAGAASLAVNSVPKADETSPNQSNSSSPRTSDPTPQSDQPTDGQPITATGTIQCLTPKDTTGPQDASCAIGLKQDDGTSYGLSSQDPTLTGSIPTGQRVKVTGSFKPQASKYDSKGVIAVTSIERQ